MVRSQVDGKGMAVETSVSEQLETPNEGWKESSFISHISSSTNSVMKKFGFAQIGLPGVAVLEGTNLRHDSGFIPASRHFV